MKKLVITIDLQNAAFDPHNASLADEVKRILDNVVLQVAARMGPWSGTLRDSNGNVCGNAKLT